MKHYILGAVFAFGILVTPAFTQAAALTNQQANSLIAVVQSAPGVPASAFVNLITAFSNITVNQASSLIAVVQSSPSAPANAFVNLLISFTGDTITPVCDSMGCLPGVQTGPSSQPTVTISDPSGNTGVTVNVSDSFSVVGTPKNIEGLSYGFGTGQYTRAYIFDSIFNSSCSNNSASDNVWNLTCTAKTAGVGNIRIDIYKDGKTYASNTVTVTVKAQTTYTLSVTKAGTGTGLVEDLAGGIYCGSVCSNNNYIYNNPVRLTATPATGSTFTGWSGACSGIGSCTVTLDTAKNVTATFTITATTLNSARTILGDVNLDGKVDSTDVSVLYSYFLGSGIIANFSNGDMNSDGQITLTDVNLLQTKVNGSAPLSTTPTTATLSVTKYGTGSGTVASLIYPNISCGSTCSYTYSVGAGVTLLATPATGSTFTGWSGACSGTSSCSVTMDAAKSVTATFTSTVVSPATIPNLTTSPVTSITQTSAIGGGNIYSNGGATVTVSGIVWSTAMNPTTALPTKTTNGLAIAGPWTNIMSGLTANTIYYVRAYAVNSVGTGYGNVMLFTTANAVTASALDALNSASQTQTQSGLTYEWNTDLQIGSNGADVTALQTALAKEGVYASEITGGFYNQTFIAVKAFQQKYGINATGYAGALTRAKLNALY